jgi:alcohol dehydrogenase class IV
MLVISPSVAKTFLLDRIKSGLGAKCVALFDEVKPHSPTDSIAKAVESTRPARFDVLVSAGGGSAIDSASRELTKRESESFYSPAALDAGFLSTWKLLSVVNLNR